MRISTSSFSKTVCCNLYSFSFVLICVSLFWSELRFDLYGPSLSSPVMICGWQIAVVGLSLSIPCYCLTFDFKYRWKKTLEKKHIWLAVLAEELCCSVPRDWNSLAGYPTIPCVETLNLNSFLIPRKLNPLPIPIADITWKHIAGLNWTNRDIFLGYN